MTKAAVPNNAAGPSQRKRKDSTPPVLPPDLLREPCLVAVTCRIRSIACHG
jgi:hypothetical protein